MPGRQEISTFSRNNPTPLSSTSKTAIKLFMCSQLVFTIQSESDIFFISCVCRNIYKSCTKTKIKTRTFIATNQTDLQVYCNL